MITGSFLQMAAEAEKDYIIRCWETKGNKTRAAGMPGSQKDLVGEDELLQD